MRHWFTLAALVLAIGCGSPPQPAQPATPAPQPSATMTETFRDCTWGEVRGAGASIWSFACPSVRIEADPSLPGFARVSGPDRQPIVRLFDIALGAALDTILPAVRAASPAPGNEACVFAPVADHAGWFEFRPTGALLEAHNAFINGDAEAPSMPCGALGPSEAGQRVFFMLPGADDKVAAVDLGSEIAQFDVETLRAAP
ncbi:MAG: hypothetical protein JNJ73_18395 [Hyphomonadaceae bacterium]|nr:hypothetical protein [Hyphomonadaceae bacterium]